MDPHKYFWLKQRFTIQKYIFYQIPYFFLLSYIMISKAAETLPTNVFIKVFTDVGILPSNSFCRNIVETLNDTTSTNWHSINSACMTCGICYTLLYRHNEIQLQKVDAIIVVLTISTEDEATTR